MAILQPPKEQKEEKPGRVLQVYSAFLSAAMRAKWLTIALTVAAFVAAVFLVRFVPQQFFPASDRPELLVDLTLPQNSSIFASETTAKRVEEVLAKDEGIDRWSTYIGRGAIRFYLPLNAQLPNPFFAQIVIVAKDVAARDRLQVKLETLLAEDFPNVVARVYPLELGPPVGWPLQYRVSGPDIEEVRRIALEVAQTIAKDSRARLINYDWMEPGREMRVKIDQDQARRLGVSSAAIAAVLNASVSGSVVTQVRDDIYLINVVARAVDEQRMSLTALRGLQVPLPNGRTVPLSQFATFESQQEYPLVWRRDRVPTLTVRADVAPDVLPDEVVSTLAPEFEKLNATLPKPYRVVTGGIFEESAKSQASVVAVVPLMIVLMLTVMMLLLVSFRRLGMVVSLLPLGLIGVVAALLISGRPLGFVAILGILSLMGMIAKNAVILIVQIESDRAEGRSVRDAVLAASTSRLRPMMLTAISTVLGLIPIAPTVFWGPMAFAIMGGLLVATLLTLVFLPTLYVTFIKDDPAPEPQAAPASA
jgi:multidrug efflux pump subunit AcrB